MVQEDQAAQRQQGSGAGTSVGPLLVDMEFYERPWGYAYYISISTEMVGPHYVNKLFLV